MSRSCKRHVVIPDTQVRKGVKTDHLIWAARYIADMSDPPDHMQLMGDWYDMPSLSSWSKRGSIEAEGRRIIDDQCAGYNALCDFFAELSRLGAWCFPVWVCEGNHEQRLDRFIAEDSRLKDFIDRPNFFGWDDFDVKHAPMGQPMHKDGVTYCHFFDLNANGDTTGRRSGQPNAHTQVRRVRGSTVAGHKQGYDDAFLTHPYAKDSEAETFAVIAGSFYQHNEGYRGPTDGYERRGIVVLNELNGKGKGVPMFVSMQYLKEKYRGR